MSPPPAVRQYREGGQPVLTRAAIGRSMPEEVITDGDRAAVRFRIKGTNTGSLMGNPPTGKAIDVGGIALVGVKAGKVTELREEFDQMGLMQQIGAMPSSQPTGLGGGLP